MNTVSKNYRTGANPIAPYPGPMRGILLFILCCCILGLVALWEENDFLIQDENGVVKLSPAREEKLDKRLHRLENAEQYVLTARIDGYYPCYNCGKDTLIYLRAGEVWKYGVSIQGEKGRYRNQLDGKELLYRVQYKGSIQECLQQEAIKIYQYALLPENLKRNPRLIRPPGNKVDL
ncbi:MAG TPA: hypothetical protein PLC89_11355 [Haliscomenobacter sp.]|uniref:hypothetical protein n=1 Tax=Haliscomenobacter sp. TaxID=2717303 RepID=UPI002CCE9FDD|nr:hypothetical protein [Haliscomenobacter sp.]HOY17888.1 hypothetical protein [Haliscomenobacter sp.]HPH18736.1 hypothetical protein [Haliscomenobacter sp.]